MTYLSRRAGVVAALFGVVSLDLVVASCADSTVDTGPPTDDTRVGASDAAADACGIDSESCTKTQVLTCDDAEWCPVKTDLPVGLGLSSVWGSGPNDVWVVGAAGKMLHWDGHAWSVTALDTTQSLFAVWGTGPSDVWTVSTSNVIFHTTGVANGAAQWSREIPIWDGEGWLLRAIWGTSPNDIWIGGDNANTRSVPASSRDQIGWRRVRMDGGTGWSAVGSFNYRYVGVRSIWGSGPADIWLVGNSFAMHTNGVAAADGGVPAWTEFDTLSRYTLNAVWGSGPGDVWAVGDVGTIRHFTAGAETWMVVDSPTSENLRGLWGTGPNDIWAVGDHGTLLHYDGSTWRSSRGAFLPREEPNLYGVWGSGPSDVWAVGTGVVVHFSGSKAGAPGEERGTP